MTTIQWVIAVVVTLVTCANPGLSLPREVTAQETEPLRSNLDVTTSEDARMRNDLEETLNNTRVMEDEQFPVSSLQEGMEFGTLEQIINVVMYTFDSYFNPASLGDWLAGLGKAARHSESQGVARFLDDLKFSPPVVELMEALRPLGFTPYPDPYIPMVMSKKDLWKGPLNWLAFFLVLSFFWRSYLPIPPYVYEKFGLPGSFSDYYDPNDYDYYKEDGDEGEQEEEEYAEDPYEDEDEKEEEEEDDLYENEEYGDEEEEEEEDENSYYKVGEEEKEEEREHESFAVFKEKEPDEMSSEGQISVENQYQHHQNSISSEHNGWMTDQTTQSTYAQGYHAPESYYMSQGNAWTPYYGIQGERDSTPYISSLRSSSQQVEENRRSQGRLRHPSVRNRRKGVQKRPQYRRIGSRRPVLRHPSSSSSSSSSFPFNLFS